MLIEQLILNGIKNNNAIEKTQKKTNLYINYFIEYIIERFDLKIKNRDMKTGDARKTGKKPTIIKRSNNQIMINMRLNII